MRKHNNDFIWDKQFSQVQRKRVCDLKDYPSEEEVVRAWKEGVEMARQLARKLGMHPDTNEQGNETSDDDKKWFDKPMEYVDFKESLRGMETEEEQETLRREALAREQQLEEATESETESNTDALCDSVEDVKVAGDIRHIVNPLLDSIHTEDEVEKRSPTLLVPGVGRPYKSTIIAELRNNPELSTDRLRRVRGAGTSSEIDNDSIQGDSSDSVGLFDDCAFYDPTCAGKFILDRVQRMRKKGKKGFVEHVRPVDLGNKPADVEVIVSKYHRISEEENSHLQYNHQETVVSMPLPSIICKVHLEINKDEGRDDDIYELSEKDSSIVTEFLKRVEMLQRSSVPPRPRNARSEAVDLEDEGRRVDTVLTSRGRLSRRVSYLTY